MRQKLRLVKRPFRSRSKQCGYGQCLEYLGFITLAIALNLDLEDQADEIWMFQKNLAAIIAMLTGADNDHNPFFLYQFNENAAT
jgi:hypothetical protein